MFHVTDTEAGLMLRAARDAREISRAQGIVDQLDADVGELRRQLRQALADLDDERGRRRAAELKLARLNAILDTPIH